METLAYLIGYSHARQVLYSGQSNTFDPRRYAEENAKKCGILMKEMEDFIRGLSDSQDEYINSKKQWDANRTAAKKNAEAKSAYIRKEKSRHGGGLFILGLMMGHHRHMH